MQKGKKTQIPVSTASFWMGGRGTVKLNSFPHFSTLLEFVLCRKAVEFENRNILRLETDTSVSAENCTRDRWLSKRMHDKAIFLSKILIRNITILLK